ncbi:type VII secretion target [Nocardia jiangsuensis]|uniref:Type VII secretion target n=1 Tax=Nocardia jiangsuensis TaxID=1691563 RepID=A0ABV8DTU4_9NOCA
MPESMNIDPAVLRQLATQHDRIAQDTREWGKPPAEWLANFLPTYGKIAQPVYEALGRYYDARQRAAENLAREHDDTAAALRASADTYEQTDEDLAARTRTAGAEVSERTGTPSVSAPQPGTAETEQQPVSAAPAAQPFGEPAHAAPGTTGSSAPAAASAPVATGTDGAVPSGATTSPITPSAPVTMAGTDQGGTDRPAGIAPVSTDQGTTAAPNSGAATAPSGAGVAPPVPLVPLAAGADERHPAQNGANRGDAVPVAPMPTPFAAAVANARQDAAEPGHVVGAAIDDDLVLARTLLAGVLAATETAVGTTWAVAVLRGPAGAGVFITSNEGRGWLPAGLHLPREISTPWLWDALLETPSHGGSPWEGIADPARVLAEFALAWGAKANAGLSALVSSGPIDPGLRLRLGSTAIADHVAPAYELDLRIPTPDTTDRLGLAGSIAGLENAAAVPDSQLGAHTLELAVTANAATGRAGRTPPEARAARQLRERILMELTAGGTVPRRLWDELRDADDLLAASMLAQRVDVGRVELGELRVDTATTLLRDLVFERRCTELVLLLEGEPARQTLRDAIYAHGQITEHPQFTAVPAAVSVPERVAVPAGAAAPGAVTAPAVAGPPAGAVAAPSTPPPERSV